MTRLERKNRTDIEFKGHGGIFDAADDAMKELWRINDEEYDYIAEFATDDEMTSFIPEFKTFGDKKIAITVVNRLLIDYKDKQNETEIF